ncbi:MAG TPA: hypothetical protein VF484_09950 [Candidatus Limnocylindrales bacterium]
MVKTYGRGSALAFLSPLLSIFMAQRGMNGWEVAAAREMQADATAMQAQGYEVVDAEEYRIPALGITWFKVTYGRAA